MYYLFFRSDAKDRYYDEDEYNDYVYTLNEKFVKGYVDRNTGKFYSNPNFNPSYFDEICVNTQETHDESRFHLKHMPQRTPGFLSPSNASIFSSYFSR